MLPASVLLDLKHPAYAWCNGNVSSMLHIYGTLFDNTRQPVFLKLIPEIKVTVVAKL